MTSRIDDDVDVTGEFTCPLCRKRSQMPFGGVRKLPDNHLIDGLIRAVSHRRPLSHCLSAGASCDVCLGPIAPSRAGSVKPESPARCLDCCKSLCAGCASAHRQRAVTATHSLYDPELVSAVLQVYVCYVSNSIWTDDRTRPLVPFVQWRRNEFESWGGGTSSRKIFLVVPLHFFALYN